MSASFALACGSALAAPAATTPAVIGAPAPAPPAMLGGVLPVSQRLDRRWPWAGTWLFPVGDTLALGAEGPGGPPAYHATRGVSLGEEGGSVHFGADLSNRVGGGIVRAAAHGVVLCVERVSRGDYGLHIVIAHRMEDGSLAYSVYAHLRPKSLRVKPGDIVSAGQPIARVGRSGRASTEHLHFEVRRPSDADERWEKTTPVDPVAFVASRLPDPDRDPTWAGGYLSWAEGAAIVPRGSAPSSRVDRETWLQMLERAAADPSAARDRRSAGSAGSARAARGRSSRVDSAPLTWKEIESDVAWLARDGHRLPPCPLDPGAHRRCCARLLGVREPTRHLHRLARRKQPADLAEVCLVLADLTLRPARRRLP